MHALINKTVLAPKAELHIHIEGSLEPELIFKLAARNNIPLPYPSEQALRDAYAFKDLQAFLDVYHAAGSVLVTQEDFADLALAYAERAIADNVVHTEIFFDPQTHMARGVSLQTVIAGLDQGLAIADDRGLSSRLIMCFLRHLPEEDAIETFKEALPFFRQYGHRLIGVGLDSTEIGIRPSTFARVFEMARAAGVFVVAHAGEEGPAEYVQEALEVLKVARIDHGISCVTDTHLVHKLVQERTPLTVCPLSNLRLNVVSDLAEHPLLSLLDRGVMVTVNSDDPAYFGGYINANFSAIIMSLTPSDTQVYNLLRNSLEASFLDAESIANNINKLNAHWFTQATSPT